jgi:hypothetical protein
MKNQSYIELIETYEELINVVCELGVIKITKDKNRTLKSHLIQRRTELLGEIEDQRDKLLINQL